MPIILWIILSSFLMSAAEICFSDLKESIGEKGMDGVWGADRASRSYQIESSRLMLRAQKNTQGVVLPAMAFKRGKEFEGNGTLTGTLVLTTESTLFDSGLFFGSFDQQIRIGASRSSDGHLKVTLYDNKGERHSFIPREAHWYAFDRPFELRLEKFNKQVWGFLKLGGNEYSIGFIEWNDSLEGAQGGVYAAFSGDSVPTEKELERSRGEFIDYRVTPHLESEIDSENQFWVKVIFHEVRPDSPFKLAVGIYEAMHESIYKFGIKGSGEKVFFPTGWHDRIPWAQLSAQETISTGQSTGWINLSSCVVAPRNQLLLSLLMMNPSVEKEHQPRDSGNIDSYDLEVLFARSPQEDQVIHRIREKSAHDNLTLYLTDLNSNPAQWIPKIRSLSQYADDRYKKYTEKGAQSGDLASSFLVTADLTPGIQSRFLGEELFKKEEKISQLLGANRPNVYLMDPNQTEIDPWDPQRQSLFKERLLKQIAGRPLIKIPSEGPFFALMGDENQVIKLDVLKKSERGIQSFRQFAQKKGHTLQDLGITRWDDLMPLEASEVDSSIKAKIRFETVWFLQISTHENIKVMADAIREIWPNRAMPIAQIYEAGFEFMPDYFIESRIGSTERFSHHFGGETTSIIRDFYHADLFRSASRAGKTKLGCIYYVCRIGQSIGTELTGLLALSRGFDFFHFYGYGPMAFGWEWMSDDRYNVDAFVAASKISRMGSKYSSYLNPESNPSAQVASILSRSSDIWSGSKENSMIEVFGHATAKADQTEALKQMNLEGAAEGWRAERDMIHWALNAANIPMEVIPEESVETTEVDRYQVLYCYTPNLSKKGQQKLVSWVKNGGSLYLGPRAATRDEYNQPLDLLKQLTGKEAELLSYQPKGNFAVMGGEGWRSVASFEVNQVEQLKVLDQLKTKKGKSFEVVGIRETLPFEKALAIAFYGDGSPAAVRVSVEQGSVIKWGCNLGAMLARTGNPAILAKKNLNALEISTVGSQIGKTKIYQRTFNQDLHQMLVDPAESRTMTKSVQGLPLGITATLFEKPNKQGALVWLGKNTSEEIKMVSFDLQVKGSYRMAKSFSGTPVKMEIKNGKIHLELNLQVSDAVELTLE